MRHAGNCARLSFYVVIYLMISCFFVSYSEAQDKVVVIPLLGDKATAPAPVEKTGHTNSIATGDDGDLQKGVVWPNPRFNENGNGTATDNLTGLIWLKNANCFGRRPWEEQVSGEGDAFSDYYWLQDVFCDLTDGSAIGDWRLPNVRELQSLTDFSRVGLGLPTGHPFTGARGGYYWSSTTYSTTGNYDSAWAVIMSGHLDNHVSRTVCWVWPVRGPE